MSDFKALAKHSTNYLFATMATKALVFISIPVYTRLLSVYEYGIINVFMSTVGIQRLLYRAIIMMPKTNRILKSFVVHP